MEAEAFTTERFLVMKIKHKIIYIEHKGKFYTENFNLKR